MVKRRTDNYIEETSVTEFALDSLTDDMPAINGHSHRRRNIRTIFLTLGALLVLIGLGLFWFSYKIGAIDTYSVTVVLSEDRMSRELLSKFRYTSWREPSESIRPFVHGPKSFEDCKILRYRRGSRSNWLFRCTYYEAEYRMPDGSLVIGPAFGPLPYTGSNVFVLGPLILAGVVMLVAGIALRPVKATETEACG